MDEPNDGEQANARSALDAAIAQLYTTFARYPLREVRTRDGAPCPDQRLLEARPLGKLDWHELLNYAQRAITEWGDADDYRHFLPRLLDLLATDPPHLGEEALLAKVRSEWRAWPAPEQAALESYLGALWRCVLAGFDSDMRNAFPVDALCCIAQVVDDLEPYLTTWVQAPTSQAKRYLAHYVVQHAQALGQGMRLDGDGWSARTKQMQRVVSWLLGPSGYTLLHDASQAYAAAPFADEIESATLALRALRAQVAH